MSKGTETRNRIIAKAAPLFNLKGFEGCSIQDIVEAVGLEKGSFYGHFPTRKRSPSPPLSTHGPKPVTLAWLR